MQTDQYQRGASIKAALRVLTEPEFQTPRLIRLRAELEAANAEIDRLSSTQSRERHISSDGALIEQLRVTLREDHLMVISEDAEVLLEGMPGITDSFRVPHKRGTDENLFKAADRVLGNAEQYEDVFIGGGWDKDFIQQARAAMDALKAKLDDGDTFMNRRSRATHSIPAAIKKGRKIMVSIDKTVTAQLRGNEAARKRWKKAQRIPKKIGRPKNNRRMRPIYPPPEEA
jgi:hypothetical protein